MANNRLFLMHRPSGEMLALGRRMSFGWSSKLTNEQINQFFTEHDSGEYLDQDDFILVMEDASQAPCVAEIDHYTGERLAKLEPITHIKVAKV